MTPGPDGEERVVAPHTLSQDPEESVRPTPPMSQLSAMSLFLCTTQVPPKDTGPDKVVTWTRQDPFHLHERIGQGGFGDVYRATQTALKRTVAVKRSRCRAPSASQARLDELMFSREALVTALLDHPNIVPVYDLVFDEGCAPMLAMKLVEGTPWSSLLAADADLPLAARLARHLPTLLAVARAADFAHSRGIVHRDIKPSQIMVGEYGQVYLGDWGLAVAMPGHRIPAGVPLDDIATPLAEAPNPAGTPVYMAPEQTTDSPAQIGPWTDVYLLGGILYLLLTGAAPHRRDNAFNSLQHAAAGIVEPPEERCPAGTIPPALSRVCMGALQADPARRTRTVTGFIAGIEDYLTGHERHARSAAMTDEAARMADYPPEDSYDRFEQPLRLLTEALQLWPDYSAATEARQRILEQFGRAALDRGDLQLASTQAALLADPVRRAQLLDQVELAALSIRRHRRQRRLAVAGAFATAVIASLLAVMLAWQQAAAQAFEQKMAIEGARANQSITAAQEREARERTARDMHRALAAMREATQELLRTPAAKHLRITDLRQDHNWGDIYLAAHPDDQTDLRARIDDIRARRAQLAAQGAAMEPEPRPLLMLDGILHIAEDTTTGRLQALEAFTTVTEMDPLCAEAWMGRAVAAARMNNVSAAIADIRQAMSVNRLAGPVMATVARDIAGQIYAQAAQDLPLPAGAVIVEAQVGTGAGTGYREQGGSWAESWLGNRHKSAAPGVSPPTVSSTRNFVFYHPIMHVDTTSPAVARFHPRLSVAGGRHAYITWPPVANAAPAYITVRHAAGQTSFTVIMDGLGLAGPPNSDLWIDLGRYDFLPGDDQYVEIAAGEDARPVGLSRFGQVCADAVCFTPSPLRMPEFVVPVDDAVTTGRSGPVAGVGSSAGPIPWEESLDAALARARRENRPLCILFWYPASAVVVHPLSQSREYCMQRLLTHPAVASLLQSRYVLANVNMSRSPDAARRFDADSGGTILVFCSPEGKVRDRIAIGSLPPSPVDLAERLVGEPGNR